MTSPRLFGIPAASAPVVAVLRRGPSDWSHLGAWDLESGEYEPGAWIKGNLYPQRCDLSPDGRWFCYLASKGPGTWRAGPTYIAVSRLPWVHALAAWGTCGTWTRGMHFVPDPRVHELGPADEGTADPLLADCGLVSNRPVAFAVEHRRGWKETVDTPARDVTGDPWDERRADRVVMSKPQPGAPDVALTVQGQFAAFREGPFRNEARVVRYELHSSGGVRRLDDVLWADWDREGRLLVATTEGQLQIRSVTDRRMSAVVEHSLTQLTPDPQPAPDWARFW